MANETYKGIEVSGTIYDNEDETARNGVSTNATSIGTLANLETEEKTNLVGSLNEVLGSIKDYSVKRFTPDSITADSSHAVVLSFDTSKFTDTAYINIGVVVNANSYQEAKITLNPSLSSSGVSFTFGDTSFMPLTIRMSGNSGKILIILNSSVTSVDVYLLGSNVPTDLFEISTETYSYAGETAVTSVGVMPSSGVMSGTSVYRASGWSTQKLATNWANKYLIMFDDGDYVFLTLNSASGSFMAYARSGNESVSGTTLSEFHGITVSNASGGVFKTLALTKAGQVIQFV